jgi:hypothetical protein
LNSTYISLTIFTQKSANLARIRDNQRRSRARRKDYLKELEERYRNCEQIGVSASTQIQAAARGVVEENRRLRSLLKAYGVSDAEIDGASGRQGSVAADMLEVMADSRQSCGSGDACQPATNSTRQLQPAPCLPTQSISQPTTRQGSYMESHSAESTPQYMIKIPSPASVAEYGGQPSGSSMYSPTSQQPMHLLPQHYGMPFGGPSTYMADHQNAATDMMTQHGDVHYKDHSSCQVAAQSIRTFSPMAGYELEQELGCRALGEDCNVSNQRIFKVIDRYTAGAG